MTAALASAKQLHRQLQLLRPRQPGGDHDRHINSATTGPQTVGITLADTTTVSEALPASLSGNENTAISLSGKDHGVGYAEHRRHAAHDADGVARHHHGGRATA